MSTILESGDRVTGETGTPVFPEYPQFTQTETPGPLRLAARNAAGLPLTEEPAPTRVWQGLITPFDTDAEARLALRLLAADQPVLVHGGTLRPSAKAYQLKPHRRELELFNANMTFDVLVTEFEAAAHPWAFSLSPPIFQDNRNHHPHLRSDRSLVLPTRLLHAFCVYSAAEFVFDPNRSQVCQFLDQVAIFLAKHVIWLRTARLSSPNSIWMIDAPASSSRNGLWPGSSATNGSGHLALDPEGPCWCGKGKVFKDCCLPWESRCYFR